MLSIRRLDEDIGAKVRASFLASDLWRQAGVARSARRGGACRPIWVSGRQPLGLRSSKVDIDFAVVPQLDLISRLPSFYRSRRLSCLYLTSGDKR